MIATLMPFTVPGRSPLPIHDQMRIPNRQPPQSTAVMAICLIVAWCPRLSHLPTALTETVQLELATWLGYHATSSTLVAQTCQNDPVLRKRSSPFNSALCQASAVLYHDPTEEAP